MSAVGEGKISARFWRRRRLPKSRRMTELGIAEADFAYFEYPGGGHGDNMPGSFERMEGLVCTLGGAQEATSTYPRYLRP